MVRPDEPSGSRADTGGLPESSRRLRRKTEVRKFDEDLGLPSDAKLSRHTIPNLRSSGSSDRRYEPSFGTVIEAGVGRPCDKESNGSL